MKKYLIRFILLVGFVFALSGCSQGIKSVKEVKVYEAISYDEINENSLVTFTNPKETKQFNKAFGKAKKQSGIVDMADPQYQVTLGGKSFYLWLNADHGTIMDIEDTHTIYRLTDQSVEHINNLLQ